MLLGSQVASPIDTAVTPEMPCSAPSSAVEHLHRFLALHVQPSSEDLESFFLHPNPLGV